MGHCISIENTEPWLYMFYSHVRKGWRRVRARTSLMHRANARTECNNLYSSGRTIWFLVGRTPGYVLVETGGKCLVDRMKWEELEFGLKIPSVWFCAVICSDCNKNVTFAWLVKISLTKHDSASLSCAEAFLQWCFRGEIPHTWVTKSFMEWSMISLAPLI